MWAEKDGVDTVAKMVDSFKEHYKDEAEFDITIEIQADSKVRDTMLTDVHNGADVFSFPDDQIISLVAGGVLMPVPNADEVASANIQDAVEAATLNDTLYGYPMTADNGYFMYYNKNYFSDDDVKSLDKMLSIAAANDKKVAMEFNSGWYLYAFFGNTGLNLSIKSDGVTNDCNWNSESGDITGVAIKQALSDIVSNPGFANMPNGDIATEIKNGNVIAGISGVWDVMNVKEAWGMIMEHVSFRRIQFLEKKSRWHRLQVIR